MGYIDVESAAGVLRGAEQGTLRTFLGVPYGAPTSGANRFRPPQTVEPWVGVRDATSFAPVAPQNAFSDEETADGVAMGFLQHPIGGTALEGGSFSEDCLRLNIWAPSDVDAPVPVLVWLHGGGFMFGSGNEGWTNGAALATNEKIVVVNVNHRLGVFGHLDLRDAEHGAVAGSANAGVLDIVAALEWIANNIAAFGGDPARVTIAGHSGGSAKVSALLAMPAAEGLFHGAIMQSGPVATFHGAGASGALRDLVLDALDHPTLDELRGLSVEALLDAQQSALAGLSGASILGESSDIPGFAPTIDAVDLPAHPFVTRGTVVPLLIGYAAHEMAAFLLNAPFFTTAMDDETALAVLNQFVGENASSVFDAATAEAPDEPAHLRFARALGVGAFGAGTDRIANAMTEAGGQVWQYRFDQQTDALRGILGACHAIEIPYVFGTAERVPLTGNVPGRADLQRLVMNTWASFVRTGNPETTAPWAAWTTESQTVCHFSGDGAQIRTSESRSLVPAN